MQTGKGAGRAYQTCAIFTFFSAIVSLSFSLLSLRMVDGHEYALYAASRSMALPLAIAYAMVLRSRGGIAALAVAMTCVQVFDAYVGWKLHGAGWGSGPLLFAAINFALLLRMNRAAKL